LTASRPVDQVIGAFFLVRRSLFDRLGPTNGTRFVLRDMDFCRRAALGTSAYMLIEARLYHIGNVSASSQVAELCFSLRSRTLYAVGIGLLQRLSHVVFTLTLGCRRDFFDRASWLEEGHRDGVHGRQLSGVPWPGQYATQPGTGAMQQVEIRAPRRRMPARSADDWVSIPARPTVAVALRQANDH
jgi:hypothetical protein